MNKSRVGTCRVAFAVWHHLSCLEKRKVHRSEVEINLGLLGGPVVHCLQQATWLVVELAEWVPLHLERRSDEAGLGGPDCVVDFDFGRSLMLGHLDLPHLRCD